MRIRFIDSHTVVELGKQTTIDFLAWSVMWEYMKGLVSLGIIPGAGRQREMMIIEALYPRDDRSRRYHANSSPIIS